MHVLVTRPEPNATRMVERLAALGVAATPAPALIVEPCPPPRLPLEGVSAVVATSRNSLLALNRHPDLRALLGLPLFVVGPGTAKAARRLGFARIVEGAGMARALPEVIARAAISGPLLLPRGETVAFDLAGALAAQGVSSREVVVYRMHAPQALPEPARLALAEGRTDGVVLMSPETAKVFTMLVQGADLTGALERLTYFCLSPAVAAAANAPAAAEVVIAEKPNIEEMLALLARRAAQFTGDI